MANWDKRFIDLSNHIAQWSKDRSRKIGSVIVGPANEVRSLGYNGFPRSTDDDIEERHERPAKYVFTEHAERNAIYNAARSGITLDGCRIYVNWFPCPDCARAIIQSGISSIICPEPDWEDDRWGVPFQHSREMLMEVGTDITFFDDV